MCARVVVYVHGKVWPGSDATGDAACFAVDTLRCGAILYDFNASV